MVGSTFLATDIGSSRWNILKQIQAIHKLLLGWKRPQEHKVLLNHLSHTVTSKKAVDS